MARVWRIGRSYFLRFSADVDCCTGEAIAVINGVAYWGKLKPDDLGYRLWIRRPWVDDVIVRLAETGQYVEVEIRCRVCEQTGARYVPP